VAGIVVGAVILLLLVGALGFFLWRRKHATTIPDKTLLQGPGELPETKQQQWAELGNERKLDTHYETDAVSNVIHEIGER
jgi:hypothetical protein